MVSSAMMVHPMFGNRTVGPGTSRPRSSRVLILAALVVASPEALESNNETSGYRLLKMHTYLLER